MSIREASTPFLLASFCLASLKKGAKVCDFTGCLSSPKTPNLIVNTSIQIMQTYKNPAFRFFVFFIFLLLAQAVQAQQDLLKGRVTDQEGLPLPLVNVRVGSSGQVTTTDSSGDFVVSVAQPTDDLYFSYIGYETQKIPVSDLQFLNVKMALAFIELEEVVLIGYAEKKIGDFAGSADVIKEEKLAEFMQVGTTLDRGLSGLVKGLHVVEGSGEPGKGANLNIRGITSPFTNSENDPLYVIDGVPFYTGGGSSSLSPLTLIAPENVESITVLKDAASTAIYGSRGANGVIIIKTKQGKRDKKVSTTVSVSTTLARPISIPKYLNAQDYKHYTLTALKRSIAFAQKNSTYAAIFGGELANALTDFGVKIDRKIVMLPTPHLKTTYNFDPEKAKYYGHNTNWADQIYRKPAISQNYAISFRGGGSHTTYMASISHLNQEGLIKGEKFKQYNFRLNLETDLTPIFSTGFSVNLGMSKHNWGYKNQNQLGQFLGARPDVAPYDADGKITFLRTEKKYTHRSNPLGIITQNKNVRNGLNGIVNIYFQAAPFEGLKIKTSVSGALFNNKQSLFSPGKYNFDGYQYTNAAGAALNPKPSVLHYGTSNAKSLTADITADYQRQIGAHGLGVLLGASRYRRYSQGQSHTIRGFSDDELFTIPAAGKETKSSFDIPVSSGINSAFGRLSYNFGSKYFISSTLRYDKSSKFGPENQAAWFPSVAAAWHIERESFFEPVREIINRCRLKASYGISGTANIADFTFKKFFTPGGLYNGNTAIVPGTQLPNPRIGWEKTKEYNVGIDLAFLQNKISVALELYDRMTDKVIMSLNFPKETGAKKYVANFGVVNNKGVELSIRTNLVDKKDFAVSLGINLSKNLNKLVSADLSNFSEGEKKRFRIGKPLNLILGYQVEGIIQNQEELDALNAKAPDKMYSGPTTAPGDYKYADINKDGRITEEKDGYQILGSAQPDWFGGTTLNARYKAFSLAMLLGFSTGNKMLRISDQFLFFTDNPLRNVEERYNVANRWSEDNKNADLPRLIYKNTANMRISSANVFDASYIKMRSLQLSYHLPANLLDKAGISAAHVFVKGNNLFTWTKFPGVNPEAASGGMASAGGSRAVSDPYPTAKSWTFGLLFSF